MPPDAMLTLQARLEADHDRIRADPLLANGGRLLHVLDPDAYGWDNVRREAETYGILGLMHVDRVRAAAEARATFGADVDLPEWEIYEAPTEAAILAIDTRPALPLPVGWRIRTETHPDAARIEEIRSLNSATGVSPTPAYYLAGDAVAGVVTMIHDSDGGLAACGTLSDRHHPAGPLARHGFAGSVSVRPDSRGMGLGSRVMAALIRDGAPQIGATTVFAGVKADNPASIAMLRHCGLIHRPDRSITVINLIGGTITR